MRPAGVAVLVAVGLAGCGSKDSGTGAGGGSGAPSSTGSGQGAPTARDQLIATWTKAGLAASGFAPTASPVGTDCAAGAVAKLDVLVCILPSAEQAKHQAEAGLPWIGDATGAAQAHGALVVVIADRKKADPTGRTINQLFKLAPP